VIGAFTATESFKIREHMNEKVKAEETLAKAKINPRGKAAAPTYRTVLVAASVGVLIGLLLKR
jgi:hypothetical protein